jgi:hypothetical protein
MANLFGDRKVGGGYKPPTAAQPPQGPPPQQGAATDMRYRGPPSPYETQMPPQQGPPGYNMPPSMRPPQGPPRMMPGQPPPQAVQMPGQRYNPGQYQPPPQWGGRVPQGGQPAPQLNWQQQQMSMMPQAMRQNYNNAAVTQQPQTMQPQAPPTQRGRPVGSRVNLQRNQFPGY